MRIDGCKKCGKLKTLQEIEAPESVFLFKSKYEKKGLVVTNNANIIQALQEYRKEQKKHIIKWYKHFNEHPNIMNLGSCRTLSDIFNITEEDL